MHEKGYLSMTDTLPADTCAFHTFPVVSGPPWQGVRYFCTTRHGGVSAAPYDSLNLGSHVGDDPHAVAENRRRLTAVLPTPPLWLRQVHGTRVWQADVDDAVDDTGISADAVLTARPGQVLAILSADCLPVLLGDSGGRVLGLAHAGWRGLAAGVLEQTFARLRRRLEHTDVLWRAWIGPGISQACFEVGMEVYQALVGQDTGAAAYCVPGRRKSTWHADLSALAARRLRRMGVQQVWSCPLSTDTRADLFYSHRRAQQAANQSCGRMATVAWKTGV